MLIFAYGSNLCAARLRRRVEVELGDGSREPAQIYVATHIDTPLKPFVWYKRYVVEGARSHGLPEEYVATAGSPAPGQPVPSGGHGSGHRLHGGLGVVHPRAAPEYGG